MDDLERLFRGLVSALGSEGTGGSDEVFEISELYQNILPYRQYKKSLGFDSHQDYEMAMLRLLAGEDGYAAVEPVEIQQSLLEEAQSINPNPAAFREFAAARVRLNREAVRRVTQAAEAYAPPDTPDEMSDSAEKTAVDEKTPRVLEETAPEKHDQPESVPPGKRGPVFEPVEAEITTPTTEYRDSVEPRSCPHCNDELPSRRQVIFCPFCGNRVAPIECPTCGSEIEPSWKFCVTCGHPRGDE
ncbi:MAG: zinc ribbon domain-containing protein [Gemmatimonadales bacterium]